MSVEKKGLVDSSKPSLLLIDRDEDSLAFLQRCLANNDEVMVRCLTMSDSLRHELGQCQSMACIINHYANDASTLDKITLIEQISPSTTLIVLTAPGLAHQQIQAWLAQIQTMPMIIDKPLRPEYLFQVVHEMSVSWQAQTQMQQRLEHLSLTQPSSRWLEKTADMQPGQAVMAEMTVMITDIRHSTRRIIAQSPEHYLRDLNHWLALQTRAVYAFEGSVIKYTGDGLLAIFEGSAKHVLAMKCAQKIMKDRAVTDLDTGIGIAEGLVMGGLLGTDLRYQFDVIGQAVHLAARLCAKAEAWQTVAQAMCLAQVQLGDGFEKQAVLMDLRGFSGETEVFMVKEKSLVSGN
ncbi:MAG: adenylate/guanylate cyclase domain-containing protein [Ghiorsea sp.]